MAVFWHQNTHMTRFRHRGWGARGTGMGRDTGRRGREGHAGAVAKVALALAEKREQAVELLVLVHAGEEGDAAHGGNVVGASGATTGTKTSAPASASSTCATSTATISTSTFFSAGRCRSLAATISDVATPESHAITIFASFSALPRLARSLDTHFAREKLGQVGELRQLEAGKLRKLNVRHERLGKKAERTRDVAALLGLQLAEAP